MFKVRDEVIIDTDHIPNTSIPIAPGTTGRIVSIRGDEPWILNKLCYLVDFGNDGRYWFAEEDLSPKDGHNDMPAPLFDLDDMELAEILMEELREK